MSLLYSKSYKICYKEMTICLRCKKTCEKERIRKYAVCQSCQKKRIKKRQCAKCAGRVCLSDEEQIGINKKIYHLKCFEQVMFNL